MTLLTDAILRSLETPDALCAYLKSVPEKPHKCGNMFRCVLANFVVDEFLAPHQVVSVAQGEITIYNHAKVETTPKGIDRIVHEDGSKWEFRTDGDQMEEIEELPEWCDTLISKFDNYAESGGDPVSLTSLEVLQEELVPGCSVGG